MTVNDNDDPDSVPDRGCREGNGGGKGVGDIGHPPYLHANRKWLGARHLAAHSTRAGA